MIDVIARGMIEESNGDISQLSETVTTHTENDDIHVTMRDKENWNSHPNDVMASGNPVQLDGLQEGIPFSEMIVSGKNLIGIAQAKVLGGNENSGYNVIDSPYSRTIIQKLQPNTTYTVKRYDSGNRFRIVLFNNEPSTAADITAKQLVINSDGSITEYTFTTDTANLWFAFTTHYATSGDAVEPIVQLEYGTTPTAYEPPITGRELTVGVSGKNLLQKMSSKTIGGLTYLTNDDGTISVTGTQTAENYPNITSVGGMLLKSGDYTLSGGTERLQITALDIDANTVIARSKLDPATFSIDTDKYVRIYTYSAGAYNGQTFNDVLYPQLEIGTVATEYEPYNGSVTIITPTSNPYIIPNDIRQQDGLNNISVSAGKLSVTGVQKNAAIKRIWDKMGMDLLFDGITSANNPAVVDLANYKFIEICHTMIANEKTYPANIRLSLDSYLSSASTITIPIVSSAINTIHTEEGTVSSLYAISAAGGNMNNTKIYGIK